MQANQVDCGVYVCIYASELIARGFANLDDGLPALPYGAGLFRRGMRGDIVEHALKRLIPMLERSGVMVPHQDPPLSKCVNKPVSPELAELDAKLRDAVRATGGFSSVSGGPRRYQRVAAWYDRRCNDPDSSRCARRSFACPFGGSVSVYGAAASASTLCRGSGWIGGLTGEEMDLLDGCTHDIVRQLTTARVWGRWERWRVELASLGGANPAPAPPAIVAAAPTLPGAAPTRLAPANAVIAPPAMALAPAQPTPPFGATAVHVGPTPMPAWLTPAPPAPSTQATVTNPLVQVNVVAFASLPKSDEGDVGNNGTTHPPSIGFVSSYPADVMDQDAH
ncbi:unnamed protein product [Closterium sp. NIES-65]|nr:unnamed protein product [Closterium sp. NIES-65]